MPAHFDVAYVSVEIEQWPDADGMSHYLIELGSFGWVQIQDVENELSQLWAVTI